MTIRPYAPVLLVGALLTAGCGPFGSSGSAAPVTTPAAVQQTSFKPAPARVAVADRALAAGAARVQKVGSAKVDGTIVTKPTGVGAKVTVHFAGKERWSPSQAGVLTLTGASVGGTTVGTIDLLLTAGAVYVHTPALTSVLHKSWAKISFKPSTSVGGVDLGQFAAQAQQLQPGQYLAMLASSSNVKAVGTATIDGVRTTHYAGSVDLQQVLARVPGVPAVWSRLATAEGVKAAHVNAWVDAQGKPRRLTMSVASAAVSTTVTLHLSAYGVKVAVTTPPAGKTLDLTKGVLGTLG